MPEVGEKAAEEMAEKIMESQSGGKADVDISGGKVKITTKEAGKREPSNSPAAGT